jgi:hypothetical protein
MKVLRRMAARRAIAAADVPAGQAQPQMHPLAAEFQAFFAALRRPWRNWFESVDVFTRHIKAPGAADDRSLLLFGLFGSEHPSYDTQRNCLTVLSNADPSSTEVQPATIAQASVTNRFWPPPKVVPAE